MYTLFILLYYLYIYLLEVWCCFKNIFFFLIIIITSSSLVDGHKFLEKIYCHYVQCKCFLNIGVVDLQHAAFCYNMRNLHCHGNIKSHACFFSSLGFNFSFAKWPQCSSVHFTFHKLHWIHSLHKRDSVQLHVQTVRERHVFNFRAQRAVLCCIQEVYF